MTFFIVGHRVFEKPFSELYIGSSVVAGNTDSVRDRETRDKGVPFEGTTYKVLDHLTLIEVYKGFLVQSNVAPNVVYEVLYDALEGEVKGVLCGVKENEGVSYYALVTKGAKSIKKQIAFYIDYVDFGLLPAIQKEIEELLSADEGTIKERFGNPPERLYAGSFVGSTDGGIALIPFATYKAKEVIPAYTGEEDERIAQLERQIEELNEKIASMENTESEEYKRLQEQRRDLIKQLAKLRNRLYNPDILKAVKSKGERLFITQKPEIRYLGENLLQTAYEYKGVNFDGNRRVKGVYAVVTLPVYNNLSKQLQRGYLELFLALYADGQLYPAELQKARQTVSVMDEALRELIKALESGTKPDLTHLKERIKENLSLKRRIEDIEKYVLGVLGGDPEEVETTLHFLTELKRELERGRRLLYSPFTISKLLTAYDLLALLQEAGLDTANLTKEGWNELFETLEVVNENLENTFKEQFENEIGALVKYFLKKLEKGEPLRYKMAVKGRVEEGYYPSPDRGLRIEDLYPNRVLINVVKGALKKLNALDKLRRLEEVEVFFGEYGVRLGYQATVAFARKVFQRVAEAYLDRIDYDREEEIRALREFLIQNWLGEFKKPVETAGAEPETEGEIVELDDFDESLLED